MKKLLFLSLFLFNHYVASAQITQLEAISKDNFFDIDKVIYFIDIIDADLKVPVTADVVIKKDNEIFQQFNNLSSFKVRLPIHASYEITVSNSLFAPTTLKLDLSEIKEYEVSQDILLEAKKIPYQIQVGDAFTDRRNVKVSLRNKVSNEQIEVKPSNQNGLYVALLRENQEYELEVKDYTSNFFYNESIQGNPTKPNQTQIKASELSTFGKEISSVNSLTNNDSLLDLNDNLLKELEAARLALAEKKTEDSKTEEENQSTENTEEPQESEVNTIEVSENGETIEVPSTDPLVNLDKTRQKIIEQQKALIEQNQAIKTNLTQILTKLKDETLSQAQKDSLQNLAEALEDELEKNDRLYQQLRQDNIDLLDQINYQLKGLTWKYFFRRFYWIIITLAIALILLLIGNGIFYRIAVLRRQQRDQQALLNEEIRQQKEEIETQRDNLEDLNMSLKEEQAKSDALLLNILPLSVANELKATGTAKMRTYKRVTILFTDFKGFTEVAAKMTPDVLMEELNDCFTAFDSIIKQFRMEKIKTIGDAYMCAGGIPEPNTTNPVDVVLAGLSMQEFMQRRRKEKLLEGSDYWQCRLGINTGEIRAGVIGTSKFAYDIWGNPVNIASRMESGGEVNRVNISGDTYALVKDFFECEYRGEIEVKNGLTLKMYFVERIKPEFSADKRGIKPNEKFWELAQEKLSENA
ncbi:MAG: adenylate/guanylate cyclase domain-containing protein [Microscillaceae bacterium]|nr:adenylate/guanylate cyclase domain-containing protein [Microscillaceae bacterium]